MSSTPTDQPEPLPTVPPPEQWRMDAYYYGFERTGVDAIDKILSAVATAGKMYHHTEDWGGQNGYGKQELPPFRGDSCIQWIQNAAADAADELRARND